MAKQEGPRVPDKVVGALRESIGRFKRRQLAGVVCVAAAGIGMFTASFFTAGGGWKAGEGLSAGAFLRWGGVFFVLLGAFGVFIIARTTVRRTRVVSALADSPREVVWIYLQDVSASGLGQVVSLALRPHVHLVDGTRAWFQVPKEISRSLFETFERQFPDMSLGYDRETERVFRSDPRALQSSPVRTSEVRVGNLRAP